LFLGIALKKLSLTLAVVFVALLTSMTVLAYSQLSNQSGLNLEENTASTSSSPPFDLSPPPNSTTTPTITVTATPDPAAEGSFGPKGYFRVTSPTNTTYNSGSLNLTITGEAINQPLLMAYNIDGKDNVPFCAVVSQEHEWDIFVGGIHASVPLPPLTSGVHRIMVFGSLSGNSGQATVHFTVT
jgi:hypothetical protein